MALEQGVIAWLATTKSKTRIIQSRVIYTADPANMVVVYVPSRSVRGKAHKVIVYNDDTALCPCKGYRVSKNKQCIHVKLALSFTRNAHKRVSFENILKLKSLLIASKFEDIIIFLDGLEDISTGETLWSYVSQQQHYHRDFYPCTDYIEYAKQEILQN